MFLLEKKEVTLLLQYSYKFDVKAIQHHHWLKTFHSAALHPQDIT